MTDKRALITAGSRGIGREIAIQFAAEGALVHVFSRDITKLQQLRAQYPAIGTSVADVSVPADVDRVVSQLQTQWGGLDILVNNAGVGGTPMAAVDTPQDEWRRMFAVNVFGAAHCVSRTVPLMPAAGGSILNISSSSTRTHPPLRLPYVASKAALEAMTRSWARELGPRKVRVNSLLPGPMDNDRNALVRSEKASVLGISVAEMLSRTLQHTALGELVPMSEIAALAVFLASDAGRHISGQDIAVDSYRLFET